MTDAPASSADALKDSWEILLRVQRRALSQGRATLVLVKRRRFVIVAKGRLLGFDAWSF